MKTDKIFKGLFIYFNLTFLSCFPISAGSSSGTISLNGRWEMGSGRIYTRNVTVPGIHTDPAKMNTEKLWYRKEILLPEGHWKFATLELKGARFSPEVFVNGVSVSKQNGGMAPTFHLLNSRDVKPGKKIIIEIALTSLKDIKPSDASYIPVADQWRTNVSSCLWDDVILRQAFNL
jgi:beta-galactosidase